MRVSASEFAVFANYGIIQVLKHKKTISFRTFIWICLEKGAIFLRKIELLWMDDLFADPLRCEM